MSTDVTHRATANGAPAGTAGSVASQEYATPTVRGVTAKAAAILSVLAGLWVAISPWFLVFQQPAARNSTVNDLIIGLAVAALALFASSGPRWFRGLEAAYGVLGIWLIISPFILSAKFAIQAPMYWSNIFAGGVLIVLSVIAVAAQRRPRAGR